MISSFVDETMQHSFSECHEFCSSKRGLGPNSNCSPVSSSKRISVPSQPNSLRIFCHVLRVTVRYTVSCVMCGMMILIKGLQKSQSLFLLLRALRWILLPDILHLGSWIHPVCRRSQTTPSLRSLWLWLAPLPRGTRLQQTAAFSPLILLLV